MTDPITDDVLKELGFKNVGRMRARKRVRGEPLDAGYPDGAPYNAWYVSLGAHCERCAAEEVETFLLLEPDHGHYGGWIAIIYDVPYQDSESVILPHAIPSATALRLLVGLLRDPSSVSSPEAVNAELTMAADYDRLLIDADVE